jgi:hypothetical protein
MLVFIYACNSPMWQCHFNDHEHATPESGVTTSRVVAIRIVLQVTHIDGLLITLKTRAASYSHVFKNVRATFHSSIFPQVAVLTEDSTNINHQNQFQKVKDVVDSYYQNINQPLSATGNNPRLRKLGWFDWVGNVAKTVSR